MQKTMKKLLSIILAILMIVTTVPFAFAAEEEAESPYAVIDTEAGTLTIDGTFGGKAEATDDEVAALTETIKDFVTNGGSAVIVTGSEMAIHYNGYYDNYPAYADALYYVTDGSTKTEFNGKVDLILPDATTLVEYEFDSIYCLKSITLPKVTTIGDAAFFSCFYVETLTFGSVITSVGKNAFSFLGDPGSVTGGKPDLVLNCGQMQTEGNYKPNPETNEWGYDSSMEEVYKWKSITLTHTPEADDGDCTTAVMCSACGEIAVEAKVSHTTEQEAAKAPTCTEIGWDAYESCTECDYTTYEVLPVDPDAHDYTNHYCKRCGKAEDGYYAAGACGADGDNLTWSLDSDGVLTISGEGEMQEIIIYAYQPWEDYDYDIKEVVIEEGVTKIARAAFFALRTLEKVTVSSTAKFEDFDFCFRSCTSLKEFIVSPANPYYCTDEYGVVFSKDKKTLLKAFDLSDVDYVIPDTVTSVADEAFRQIKIKSLIVNYTSMNMAAGAEVGKLIVDCDWVVMAAFESATIGELVLTNKVRYIENLAFLDAGITSAHYLGDSANLNIGEDNDGLTDVLHYCEHKEALVPTCTAIGWEAYEYCTECDYTTKVEIPVDPDAHDIIIDKAVAPDCTNTGLTEGQHCSRCNNATITQEVIPALNHKDTLVQVDAKAPTCTEIGWDAYEYCTACTYTTYVEKEALNHKDTLVQVEAKAPTCTEVGWDAYEYCTACTYTTYVEKEALKHSFTKYEVTEEAKCGVEGKEVATCDHGCGATDEKAIEALTHTDADGDYICDHGCGYEYEKPAPEEPTPDTPDEPTDEACDHLCHKSGILGFFWKIVKFFSKLFKINPVCECGAAHY